MRFFLDNNVPASVGRMLRNHGHTCWTAGDAGLADEDTDDNLTVYAHKQRAVLVTLDKEFTRRRRQASIGQHVRLRCREPEAVKLLERHVDEVFHYLRGREHVTVDVRHEEVTTSSQWQPDAPDA